MASLKDIGNNNWKSDRKFECVCGYEFDAFHDTKHEPGLPPDGAATVCLRCGHLMIFVVSPLGQVSLREATADEFIAFQKENGDKIVRMGRARQAMRRMGF